MTHLFAGSVGTFADGRPSAIFKSAVDEPRRLDEYGVAGDEQANHEYHAGPERALNHFPAEHYAFFISALADQPLDTTQLQPGVFGENISTQGLTEADVHIGDVFQLGKAVIQIAQPRQPCWKIGERIGYKSMARELIGAGRAGWLYRVLEAGDIQAGDTLTRAESAAHGISLADLWACQNARHPSPAQVEQLAFLTSTPLLAVEWRHRLGHKLPA